MDEEPERAVFRRPWVFACAARRRKSRPARAHKGAWGGRKIVSAKWIERSVMPRFQAIGFGGLFLRAAMVDRPHAIRRQGREMDCSARPRRPAHLHRPRTRPCDGDDFRAIWRPRQGMRRSTSWPISSSLRQRKQDAMIKPGNTEPEIHRRRPHHPPHHRAGNHLLAGAGDAAGPDAGSSGGEPGMDAKGRRARRQGRVILCFQSMS